MSEINSLIIKGVTIIDGTGREPEPNKVITIEEGLITRIEDLRNASIPQGIEVWDLDGLFVLPGLIDAHIHLAGAPIFGLEMLALNIITAGFRSIPQAWAILKWGFTSVRDLSRTGLYLKRVVAEGSLPGPRIVSAGPGLATTGGAGDLSALPPSSMGFVGAEDNWSIRCDGAQEIRKAVRLLLREGADQIKFFANGSDGSPVERTIDQHFTTEEMKLIVAEAKRVKGTRVLSHISARARDVEIARNCLEAGVDSIEHIPPLGEELCEKMAREGVFLVPTVNLSANFYLDFQPEEEGEMMSGVLPPFFHRDVGQPWELPHFRDDVISRFKMAYEKGVKIALGSDPIDDLRTPYGEYSMRELKAMVDFGMTPLEGIRAATQIGAEVLGLEHQIGTVQEGKLADLIVVDGDPSSSINVLMEAKNLKYVIQRGEVTVDHGKLTAI
jgi:imidazolonepropionase-like amidohydrolase